MHNIKYQSGVVLPVSMIMMLLLTLIAITGSQETGLEEKMAGNTRDYSMAFQAAEAALRFAEAATSGSPVLYTGGQPVDWTDAAVTTYSGGTLDGIREDPEYVIEALPVTTGTQSGAGGSLEVGAPPDSTTISWYRITARATGGTTNAVVTLQSVYKR